MYQPLGAPVQTKPIRKELTTEQKLVQVKPATAIASQPMTKGRTWLTRSAKRPSSHALRRSQPQAIQPAKPQGQASSVAIAKQASSEIAQPASPRLTQQLTESWNNFALSQPQWTNQFAIAALLLSLPAGASVVAFQAIATPNPQSQCNHLQPFLRADLAKLQCLRQAMQSRKHRTIISSLRKLQNWSSESPVYSLSQSMLEDWSVVALSLAHQEFEAGRWENASRLAAAIPTSLDLSHQAQDRLTLWQKVQRQGENAYELALEALEQQDWKTARNHAQTLANLSNDYWRQQGIQALPEQIELARQAQQVPSADEAELSASAQTGLPIPNQGQRQRRSQPTAMPRRSRFTMPLISLKELTVGGPSPATPEFSVTV